MGEAKENPELAEVQAIFLNVQQLSQAPGDGSAADSLAGQGQAAPGSRPNIVVLDRKHKALQKTETEEEPSSKVTAIYLGIAAAVILFAAGIITVQVGGLPGGFAVGSQESEGVLLTEAHRLLSQGDVARARARLLRGGPERRAGVAFALAQTYDPNFLRSLPNANSVPEPSEAERWYRKWYELAGQSGLEMDAGRLQRMINSMQKH
jgi:hypothetical protein